MDDALYSHFYAIEERHWWFRGRRAVIEALLAKASLPGGARILDAGAGTGRNLERYARLGRAEGVEPSQIGVDFCRERGLDVRLGRLETLPFEDGRFDLVCATDVLEHIPDDGAALRELRRAARPGGWLVATVPAYGWLWSHHDDSHHHVRRYTRRTLVAVAREAAWEPAFASYFNTALLAPIAAVRLAQRLRPPPPRTDYELTPRVLNAALERPLRAEARLIAAGLRSPVGVSVGLVCRAGRP